MKQIKLNQSHVHAGVGYLAGDVIDVTDADAAYLVRYQIGTAVKSADENTGKTDIAEQQPPTTEQTENSGINADTVPLNGETNESEQGEQ